MTHATPTTRRAAALMAATVAAAGLAACGGSASKPSYCSDKSDLSSSVKGLTSVDLKSNGISALQTQLLKVQGDAKSVVSSAKSDFPDQTSAITTSVDSLSTTVKGLSSSPSVQDIAGVATGTAAVASAVKGFSDATTSKC